MKEHVINIRAGDATIVKIAHSLVSNVTAIGNHNIRQAVDEWLSNRTEAKDKYGDIKFWDVSLITDMQGLFQGRTMFNDDISNWQTSSVTNMAYLFNMASAFNQDLYWDTSRVTSMDGIFSFATVFNGDISSWSTGSLQSMDYAFSHATAFNGDISSWQTSRVRYMAFAFRNATSFSQDLSEWSVSQVEDMDGMFFNANSFAHTLCWDVPGNIEVTRLFCGSQGTLDSDCVSHADILGSLDTDCSDVDEIQGQIQEVPEGEVKGEGVAVTDDELHEGFIEGEEEENFDLRLTPSPSFTYDEAATPSDIALVDSGIQSDPTTDLRTTTPQLSSTGSSSFPPDDQSVDPLKYAAIAVGTGTLILVLFLFILVICARRKIKANNLGGATGQEISTVYDSESVVSDEEESVATLAKD